MKTLCLLLLISFFQTANATTYYFSTNSGDDSRSPAEAQNSSTPWKTLSKLNSFFSRLQPGDVVLLKRGETFYGSINVNRSGAPGSPIVIGAYGTGNKPVITSLVTLSHWTFKGQGIWESDNSSLGSSVNTVLLNGEEQQLGRAPNSDAVNKGYLNYESHVGTSSITDADFSLNKNWRGAEVVIRSRRWTLDRNIIISNTRKEIIYKAASKYSPYDKQGYFIQNDIKTLDKFGEWYYNPSKHKLSVYFGSNNPSSYAIQAPAFSNLLYSWKFSYIVFNNLQFKGANGTSVYIRYGSNINIKNCDIEFSGRDGVEAKFHNYFTMENCTISNSNNSGIDLGYGGNYAIIRNNKITNTSIFAGMGGSGDGEGLGIQSNGNGSIMEYNEIRNTGYIGIHFNGHNVTIKNNLIDNFCTIKDDGAGIYSHTGSNIKFKGRKVIGNIIINGSGAPEGTSNPSYSPAEGIYMDNDASDVEIRGNTIANCKNNGIYIHNAYEIAIRNNTIFNNKKQLNVIEDADHSRIRKCEFTNNIFFSKLPTQGISFVTTSGNDINLLGKFNNNYYARPLNDKLGIFSSHVKNGKQIGEKLDLQDWKDKLGQDQNSKKAPKQIPPYKVNKLIGFDKVSNGTFSNNINGLHKSSCKVSWSNSGLLDGGFVKVEPTTKKSSVYIKIGEVKPGKNYILKYSLRGSVNSSMTIGTFLRQNGGTYKSLSSLQSRKAGTARSENQIVFSPSSVATAHLVFETDNKNTYYLDNIEFYEADVTVANPDEEIRFVYNATNQDKTISLSTSYVDVRGKKFSRSITLKPYTSAVLIKDGDKSSKNLAPNVKIISPDDGDDFLASPTINISANASDKDGSISKVEFYNGKTLLARDDLPPYTFSWKNVPNGNYTITATATDNKGLATTSAKVKVSVKINKAPTINIVTPSNKQIFTGPAKILLVANATDVDGTIRKVEFYIGTTLLHTETLAPYGFKWRKVPVGNYILTAKATDNYGRQTTSERVEVSVIASKQKRPSSANSQDSAIQEAAINTGATDSISIASTLKSSTLSLKLSPNPANNILNILTKGLQQDANMQVSVLSVSGVVIKTIQSNSSNQNIQLDVSSLGSGIYIVRIVCGDQILNKQFVKL